MTVRAATVAFPLKGPKQPGIGRIEKDGEDRGPGQGLQERAEDQNSAVEKNEQQGEKKPVTSQSRFK